MNKFSPPTRQMPSRSMISSLPTKSRFIGSSTSFTRRPVSSMGVMSRFKKSGSNGWREVAVNADVRAKQIVHAHVPQPRQVDRGDDPIHIQTPKPRMIDKRIDADRFQSSDADRRQR